MSGDSADAGDDGGPGCTLPTRPLGVGPSCFIGAIGACVRWAGACVCSAAAKGRCADRNVSGSMLIFSLDGSAALSHDTPDARCQGCAEIVDKHYFTIALFCPSMESGTKFNGCAAVEAAPPERCSTCQTARRACIQRQLSHFLANEK